MKALFTLLTNLFPFLRDLYADWKKAQVKREIVRITKKNYSKLEKARKDLADRVDANAGADRP